MTSCAPKIYQHPYLQSRVDTTITEFQDYPIPFSPYTLITFDVPESAYVNIIFYNVSGEAVGTLVDSLFMPGLHTTDCNALILKDESLPSGVYFYQLQTEGCIETKKMLLLK